MKINIHAGQRVLYKHDNQWRVGALENSEFHILNDKGLYLRIVPKDMDDIVHVAEINDIFLEATELDGWIKDYPDIFMPKQDYIALVERDDETFVKAIERAYVSDGEYYYYPVTKFNRAWLEKQPFDYIVRLN